jgi:small subunit ribosomal protein S18
MTMAEENTTRKKLFVSNIDFEITRDSLRDMFEEAGPCVSVVIAVDRETKRSRGFAFVEMESDQYAQIAVEKLNNKMINGRPMKVTFDKGKTGSDEEVKSDGGSYRPEILPPIQRIQIFKPKRRTDPYEGKAAKRVDYCDVAILGTFVSDRGKLLPRRMTGLSAVNQRKMAKAVKRAQSLGLMPYSR